DYFQLYVTINLQQRYMPNIPATSRPNNSQANKRKLRAKCYYRSSGKILNQRIVSCGVTLMKLIKGDQSATALDYVYCQQQIVSSPDSIIRHDKRIREQHNAAFPTRIVHQQRAVFVVEIYDRSNRPCC